MAKSDFISDEKEVDGVKFLLITDLNLGAMSVTNDIENVISTLKYVYKEKQLGNLGNHVILCKDSEGRWDGWSDELQQFFPVGGITQDEAINNYLRIKK